MQPDIYLISHLPWLAEFISSLAEFFVAFDFCPVIRVRSCTMFLFKSDCFFFNALTDIYSRNWPEKQHMFYAHPMVLCDTSYYGCKLSHRLNNKNHIA